MKLLQRRNRFTRNFADIPITRTEKQYTLPGMLARSSYDNGFAPISAISDEILKRNIRLGDTNNPELDVSSRYQFWDAITHPNDRMGFLQFIDSTVAGFLSLPEYSLLVWSRNGDTVKPGKPDEGWTLDNIAGFTVVSNENKTYDSKGQEQWELTFGVGSGTHKFSRDDIITLKYSLLPDDGITGVSPGSASAQEAAIRDRLNQQQRALFDNGATPSIIVTIYARSHDEYEAIQKAYEKNNRGAAKQGGVVYQSVIDRQIAGMGEPRIEITPVGTPNNSLAIKDIVDFTEKKITSNYGVSPIIYGDATTTTFQNQELAKSEFMHRVQAILVRLFSSFESEIVRLVGFDLPFTFVWDNVELDLTQELEIRAKTKTETVRAFLALIQSGVSASQARTVLELDDSWADISITPNPDIAIELEPQSLNLYEQGCSCEHRNEIPTRISELEQNTQKKIVGILKNIAKELYEDITVNAVPDSLNVNDKALIEQLTRVMEQGYKTTGAKLASDTIPLADFGGLSQVSRNKLGVRVSNVITNYVDFVSDKLQSLDPDDPVRKTFTRFYNSQASSKANVIAQQEVKTAYQNGELDVAKQVNGWLKQNEPMSVIEKIWRTTSGNPCEFCALMEGTVAGIQDSFVPGGLIDAEDTTLLLDQNYTDGTIPDAHVNCQCVFEFELRSK
jgi:phage portal protein BeeE